MKIQRRPYLHERFVWNAWGSMSIFTNDYVHGVTNDINYGINNA